jgi:hypothetical protein
MDYLDPKKKNQHKKRLMIGYGLMAIVIVLMTLILQYIAGGYFIDKNGQLIQNGLLYITTEPGDATVFLDGQKQRDTTESRLVIPAAIIPLKFRSRAIDHGAKRLKLRVQGFADSSTQDYFLRR